MRGDNVEPASRCGHLKSVHPHVRGDNDGWHDLGNVAERFTPTCVGTTCGLSTTSRSFSGSPPRAWGQRYATAIRKRFGRFTPTCVGTTSSARARPIGCTVHPHVRGDNDRRDAGSPRCVRFTPTCVGTTGTGRSMYFISFGSPPRAWGQRPARWCTPLLSSVHPHVRGDNDFTQSRVWPRRGFTPTCVGTTCQSRCQPPRLSVHPHVRGDNARRCPDGLPPGGSPPRAWGQPKRDSGSYWPGRFTPTCVGTTLATRHPVFGVCGSPPRAWGQRPG